MRMSPVVGLLAEAHALARERGSRALGPLRLTLKHYECLETVEAQGPISQRDLGEVVRVDRTTMVRLVDDLERDGYVVRRRNREDRRAYALQATPKGRKCLAAARDALGLGEDDLLRPLKAIEREVLVGLLRKLIAR